MSSFRRFINHLKRFIASSPIKTPSTSKYKLQPNKSSFYPLNFLLNLLLLFVISLPMFIFPTTSSAVSNTAQLKQFYLDNKDRYFPIWVEATAYAPLDARNHNNLHDPTAPTYFTESPKGDYSVYVTTERRVTKITDILQQNRTASKSAVEVQGPFENTQRLIVISRDTARWLKDELNMEVADLLPTCKGPGYNYSGNYYSTADGTKSGEGIIAVPGIIPLGTKVFVQGYGQAEAHDHGKAIVAGSNKMIIDLLFEECEKAYDWGRESGTIMFVEKTPDIKISDFKKYMYEDNLFSLNEDVINKALATEPYLLNKNVPSFRNDVKRMVTNLVSSGLGGDSFKKQDGHTEGGVRSRDDVALISSLSFGAFYATWTLTGWMIILSHALAILALIYLIVIWFAYVIYDRFGIDVVYHVTWKKTKASEPDLLKILSTRTAWTFLFITIIFLNLLPVILAKLMLMISDVISVGFS